jgi:uncharacterized membrane protein
VSEQAKPSTGKPRTGKLLDSLQNLASAAGERAGSMIGERINQVTDRLIEYAGADGDAGKAAAAKGAQQLKAGKSPVNAVLSAGMTGGKEQLKQAFGKDGKKGRNDLKVTNIVETIDVGVPVRVAYNQWTQFEDFPSFMKKVENVEQEADEKLTWKAQVFWSHRSWESTIIEQVPDERIVWQSQGDKGSVDGTVSFHELTPDLTRILVVLQYHPQGFFERTGNLWRAQGRRVRLELKHFVRHVMTDTVLHPDEVPGWRGEIRDGELVQDDESARRQERDDDGGDDPADGEGSSGDAGQRRPGPGSL